MFKSLVRKWSSFWNEALGGGNPVSAYDVIYLPAEERKRAQQAYNVYASNRLNALMTDRDRLALHPEMRAFDERIAKAKASKKAHIPIEKEKEALMNRWLAGGQ